MIRLKELRLQKRLKQSELAEVLHVKQNTISNWENGKTEISNADAIAIANFFGVTVDYLLGRSEEKTPSDEELSEGERELIELVSQLTDDEIKQIAQFIQFLVSQRKS